MIVKHVTFYIKKEYIQKFIEATLENQKNSIQEDGVICFDFCQCSDDETKFLLYEGYESEKDMDEHLNTQHFKKWIDTVEDCFLSPRERVIYTPISK